MDFFILGSIIGLVMGLTGSGGSLVAIPLFMSFLGLDLKQASVFSLVAVMLASGINFVPVRRLVKYRAAFTMFSLSLIGSYFTIPLKQNIPETIIAFMLSTISLYSLFIIWRSPEKEMDQKIGKGLMAELLAGLMLGILTTLTGLGGGVLLMPVLIGTFKMDQKQAVATSLLTIFLSSGASLLLQIKLGFKLPEYSALAFLSLSIILSASLLHWLSQKLAKSQLDFSRRLVFTCVVVLALYKIF